jgi:hypothetical protein
LRDVEILDYEVMVLENLVMRYFDLVLVARMHDTADWLQIIIDELDLL